MIELPILDAARGQSNTPVESTDPQAPKFWRSVGELEGDPSLAALASKEFLPGAMDAPDGTSRRQFIQLMGASMALAGLTGCRKPYEKILPYARKPEEVVEGIAMHYATAMPFRGSLSALLVESHEGRPTKVEGNPEHPISRGASGVFEQASILNLYDPDRSAHVLEGGADSDWGSFVAAVSAIPTTARVGVLIEENSSPTIAALRQRVAERFGNLKWVSYNSVGENTQEAGYASAFGRAVRPQFNFSQARVVVSLDADFLAATDVNFVRNTREFAEGRSVDDHTPLRHYVFEPTYSTTGGMADHRARVKPSEVALVAAALASRLGVGGAPPAAAPSGSAAGLVEAAAADLRSAGANGVVVAGDTQPAEVHAICAAINSMLGAVGNTVTLFDTAGVEMARRDSVADLVDDVKSGQTDVLVMIGVNPAYDLAGDSDLLTALEGLGTTIHVGQHVDETATLSSWHVPQTHYLESWGDGRAYDGTLSVVQPLIAPLYSDCKSAIEVLSALAMDGGTTGYDQVLRTWESVLPGNVAQGWRRVLHDGYLPDSGFSTLTNVGVTGPLRLPASSGAGASGLEVQIRLDTRLLDGSFANNAWLQETPELATKIVWDNVAVMNRATAEQIGVTNTLKAGKYYADEVRLSLDGRAVTLPAWIAPGIADDTIILSTGHGRSIVGTREKRRKIFFDLDEYTDIYGAGPIANGVGKNVAALRSASFSNQLSGVAAEAVPARYHIVTTQDHGALDLPSLQAEIESREPVRMATLSAYQNHEAHFEHAPLAGATEPWDEYPALWEDRHPSREEFFKDNPYYENQWGMTIDLNTCTGCNACSVACQAENNIQVVGKEEVGHGREMSWIRLDRYFVTEGRDIDEAMMVVQPLPCQHCENAPCESVCPVAATVHSPDGTNQMIYNRCIGTRYCANNCPYKVRRFNFYNWTKTLPTSVQMAQNPNVTVRFRGVMEKCSYCIQRVRKVNIQANLEDRSIRDGEVVTACQQACPANAITFGDISDPTSAIAAKKESDRRYELLEELSVKPRTSYLGRIQNPNPSLA